MLPLSQTQTPSSSSLVVARTAAQLQAATQGARHLGQTVGFVPTMGALHDGHAALVRAAAASCDCVVVSIFVNPTQFNNTDDLTNYPRTEAADLQTAADAGATIAFVPAVDVIYPDGFATTITPGKIAEPLEGAHRPGHFDGMATVVVRLLGLVQPDVAYFGRKDAQQLAIIQQVVRDLALPVQIVGVDTARDSSGLALSSRNARLSAAEREQALGLSRGLFAARDLAGRGERSARALQEAAAAEFRAAGLTPDYVALVDETTFLAVDLLDRPCILAVAAAAGPVRLIDNIRLNPAACTSEHHGEPPCNA